MMSMSLSRFTSAALFAAATLAVASSAQAIIVVGGDATYTGVPAGLAQQYASVGQFQTGAAIYLGNNWVLTAAHINSNPAANTVFFDAGAAPGVPGTAIRLNYPGTSTPSDLVLFQVSNVPASVQPVTLAASSPTAGTAVTMIGYGKYAVAEPTEVRGYNVDEVNPTTYTWTQVTPASAGEVQGVVIANNKRKRYATNTVITATDDDGQTGVIGRYVANASGTVSVRGFVTSFSGAAGNGQAGEEDSGGGVFNAAGQLVGILDSIRIYEDQPTDVVIYGSQTVSANIADYRDQIVPVVGAIPEPASLALALPAVALLRRKRR
jgi:hypothetical protein